MRRYLLAILMIPCFSWGSYQPVTGSTIVITAQNGNTTAIPVSGSGPFNVTGSTVGVISALPLNVTGSTVGVQGITNPVQVTLTTVSFNSVQPVSLNSGVFADSTSFTLGTSSVVPIGGVYLTNQPILNSTTTAAIRINKVRSQYVTPMDDNGTILSTSTANPLFVYQSNVSSVVAIGTLSTALSSTTIVGSTVGAVQVGAPWSVSGSGPFNTTGSTVGISGITNPIQITLTTVTFNGTAQPVNVIGSTMGVVNGGTAFNVTVNAALPAGSNAIGTVIQSTSGVNSSTIAVVNATGQTLAVTGSGPFNVTGSTVGIISALPINVTGSSVGVVAVGTLSVALSSTTVVGSTVGIVGAGTLSVAFTNAVATTTLNVATGTVNSPVPLSGIAVGGNGTGGNFALFQVDSSSFLKVNVAAGGGSGGTSSNFNAVFPGPGTAVGFSNPTGNMQAARVDSSSDAYVTIVQSTVGVVSALPLNVTGSTVGVSGITNSIQVTLTTITFNGSAQPVSLTGFPLVPTGVNASTVSVTGSSVTIFASGVSSIPVTGTFSATFTDSSTGTIGAAMPTTAVYVGGKGTNGNFLGLTVLTTSTFLGVSPQEDNSYPTYTASTTAFAVINSTTDITELCGNATNKVMVTNLSLTCTQTTAGVVPVQIIYRSSQYSGTWSTITNHPDDSNYSASLSSAVFGNLNNFTNGTLSSYLDNAQIGCMATGTASPNDIYISPSSWQQHAVLLRGTSQCIGVNTGGTAVTGNKWTVTWRWKEVT